LIWRKENLQKSCCNRGHMQHFKIKRLYKVDAVNFT
jgi:hypothetical protein